MTNDSAVPLSLCLAPPPGSDCSLPEAVQGRFPQVTPAGPGISSPQKLGWAQKRLIVPQSGERLGWGMEEEQRERRAGSQCEPALPR